MEELRTATVDDVRAWLKAYYVPSNAVLILVGDIDVARAREVVPKYFSAIPPGGKITRLRRRPAAMVADRRERTEMTVDQARIYKSWNIPGLGTADYDILRLFADVLGSGRGSRLHERLVATGIATDVSAWIHARELGSSLVVQATARAGADTTLDEIERIIGSEIGQLLAKGPSLDDLARARSGPRNWILRETERVGGYGGQSDQIGWSYFFAGRPDHYAMQVRRWSTATPEQVRLVAAEWLRHGAYVLEVYPTRARVAHSTDVDRSSIPVVGEGVAASFPALQEARLTNGLKVVVAPRPSGSIIGARMLIGGGLASDPRETPGLGSFLLELTARGKAGTSEEEHARAMSESGARIAAGTELDAFVLDVSAPRESFARALDLLAGGVIAPRIDGRAVDQRKQEVQSRIAQDLGSARALTRRVLPSLLYPDGHPYAAPWSGTGSSSSVAAVTADALLEHHRTWFRPNNSTLVIAGQIGLAEAVGMAERAFGEWQGGQVPSLPVRPIGNIALRSDTIYVIHKTGATQSEIAAAYLVPPTTDSSEVTLEAVGRLLALGSNSRLARNLREEKNWAYTTSLFRPDALQSRPFVIHTAVRPERTADAVKEILRELRGVVGERSVTPDELRRVTNFLWLGSAGRLQSTESLAIAAARTQLYGLPRDFYATYPEVVRRIDTRMVTNTAARAFGGRPLVLIVGDKAVVEAQLKSAGLSKIKFIEPQ